MVAQALPLFIGRLASVSRGLVALDVDLAGALAHHVAVVPGLHAQQRVHRDAEGLLDPQGHLRRQGRLAIHQVGQSRAADPENLRRARDREAELGSPRG
jgi:hypothetical protein